MPSARRAHRPVYLRPTPAALVGAGRIIDIMQKQQAAKGRGSGQLPSGASFPMRSKAEQLHGGCGAAQLRWARKSGSRLPVILPNFFSIFHAWRDPLSEPSSCACRLRHQGYSSGSVPAQSRPALLRLPVCKTRGLTQAECSSPAAPAARRASVPLRLAALRLLDAILCADCRRQRGRARNPHTKLSAHKKRNVTTAHQPKQPQASPTQSAAG